MAHLVCHSERNFANCQFLAEIILILSYMNFCKVILFHVTKVPNAGLAMVRSQRIKPIFEDKELVKQGWSTSLLPQALYFSFLQ